jgi:hypothetical protein
MKQRVVALFLISLIIMGILPFCFAVDNYNLSYDANGNLVQSINKYYEYNSLNQLVSIRQINSTGAIIEQYSYDDSGERIKKIDYTSDGSNSTTYYIDNNFVQVVNSSGKFNTTYYYSGNDLVAESDQSGNKLFYHPDHLGSNVIKTSGETVESAISKEAHHILPQKFEFQLNRIGLNIHDPKFGVLVEKDLHKTTAYTYNKEFSERLFSSSNIPSKEEIIKTATDLTKEFGFRGKL